MPAEITLLRVEGLLLQGCWVCRRLLQLGAGSEKGASGLSLGRTTTPNMEASATPRQQTSHKPKLNDYNALKRHRKSRPKQQPQLTLSQRSECIQLNLWDRHVRPAALLCERPCWTASCACGPPKPRPLKHHAPQKPAMPTTISPRPCSECPPMPLSASCQPSQCEGTAARREPQCTVHARSCGSESEPSLLARSQRASSAPTWPLPTSLLPDCCRSALLGMTAQCPAFVSTVSCVSHAANRPRGRPWARR